MTMRITFRQLELTQGALSCCCRGHTAGPSQTPRRSKKRGREAESPVEESSGVQQSNFFADLIDKGSVLRCLLGG